MPGNKDPFLGIAILVLVLIMGTIVWVSPGHFLASITKPNNNASGTTPAISYVSTSTIALQQIFSQLTNLTVATTSLPDTLAPYQKTEVAVPFTDYNNNVGTENSVQNYYQYDGVQLETNFVPVGQTNDGTIGYGGSLNLINSKGVEYPTIASFDITGSDLDAVYSHNDDIIFLSSSYDVMGASDISHANSVLIYNPLMDNRQSEGISYDDEYPYSENPPEPYPGFSVFVQDGKLYLKYINQHVIPSAVLGKFNKISNSLAVDGFYLLKDGAMSDTSSTFFNEYLSKAQSADKILTSTDWKVVLEDQATSSAWLLPLLQRTAELVFANQASIAESSLRTDFLNYSAMYPLATSTTVADVEKDFQAMVNESQKMTIGTSTQVNKYPIITVSPLPTISVVGSRTVPLFSFQDLQSSIITTSATIDGMPIISGQPIQFNSPGNKIIRISAIDSQNESTTFQQGILVNPQVVAKTSVPNYASIAPTESMIIKWTAPSSVATVSIDLLNNSNYLYQIASSTENNGSYTWTVPASTTPSPDYSVQIIAGGYPPAISPNFFISQYSSHACLAAGTEILMADGSYKSIENINVGDRVISFEPEGKKEIISVVSDLLRRNDPIVVINGTLRAAPDEMAYLADGSSEAVQNLKIGDRLLQENNFITIKTISTAQGVVPTYDLVLQGGQNFFADDYLVKSATIGSN